MSDNKNHDSNGKGDAAKKGLPRLVLVAVGAALGGTGVVFALPPKQVQVPVQQSVHEFVSVEHPDIMEFDFNPRSEAGKAYASAEFHFVYRVREDREHDAFELIKAHWSRARSNVLMLLRARSMVEMNASNGQDVLSKDIVDELDAVLFPGHKDSKLATVTEVLWSKFYTH